MDDSKVGTVPAPNSDTDSNSATDSNSDQVQVPNPNADFNFLDQETEIDDDGYTNNMTRIELPENSEAPDFYTTLKNIYEINNVFDKSIDNISTILTEKTEKNKNFFTKMSNTLKKSNSVIRKVITKIGKLFDLIDFLNKSIKGRSVNISKTNAKIKMLIEIINRYSQKFVNINDTVREYVNNLKKDKENIYTQAKDLTKNTNELNNIIDNRMEEIGIFNLYEGDDTKEYPLYFTYNQLQNVMETLSKSENTNSTDEELTTDKELMNLFGEYIGKDYKGHAEEPEPNYETIKEQVEALQPRAVNRLFTLLKVGVVDTTTAAPTSAAATTEAAPTSAAATTAAGPTGGRRTKKRVRKTKKNKTKKGGKRRRKTRKRKIGKRRGGKS